MCQIIVRDAICRRWNSCLLYTSKDVEDSNLGLKGSPTQIARASDKVRKGAGEQVTLDPAAAADYIVEKLAAKHVI